MMTKSAVEVRGPFIAPCGERVDRYDALVWHMHTCGRCFFETGQIQITERHR
jgi:hypothetical protein